MDRLIRQKKIIVCCGAGGVGKTTTAAAIGIAAAMAGRRVLVLTIDPARRLAEAMGIPESGRSPSRVPDARLKEAHAHGEVWAWMLDPRVVFEQMVRRLCDDPVRVERIISNRLYGALSELISGMQEYSAAEALYTFVESGAYDLVVLDTPPSRNALEFLEAPRKLSLFLDEKVVGVFLPHDGDGVFWNRARQLVGTIFGRIFGEGFFQEIQEFLSAFSGMFAAMRQHADAVRTLLTSDDATFLLVTSPNAAALEESLYLQNKLLDMKLPFGGYVLNRSWAYTRGLGAPEDILLPADAPAEARSGLAKLVELANDERRLATRDRALLQQLREQGGHATATPHLGSAIETFLGLIQLAESMISMSPTREPLLAGQIEVELGATPGE